MSAIIAVRFNPDIKAKYDFNQRVADHDTLTSLFTSDGGIGESRAHRSERMRPTMGVQHRIISNYLI